jgi:hypothetical protein
MEVRAASRLGWALPAYSTSGGKAISTSSGKAILARRTDSELREEYAFRQSPMIAVRTAQVGKR